MYYSFKTWSNRKFSPSKAGLLMACKRSIVTSTDKGSKYNLMIKDNELGFAYGDDEPE